MEEAQQKMDQGSAEKLANKLKKGKKFDLEDFRDQLRQMGNMGGIGSMMDKLPGMANIPAAAKQQVNDKELGRLEAIINSMTIKERQRPDIIKGSRKKRIAAGCGMQIQDVNRLLKQFAQMQKMMKKMSQKGGMAKMMRGLGGRFPSGGGMPF